MSIHDPAMIAKHPEIFSPDRGSDPLTRSRTVPMEVLSLGMPRTGTASMKAALEILGIPCWHSYLLFSNVPDCAMWQAAEDWMFLGKGLAFTNDDWDQLIGHYGAVTDVPAICFAEELQEAYPDAKVVLVERDVDKWFDSFDKVVIASSWDPSIDKVRRADRSLVGPTGDTQLRWMHGWMKCHSKAEMRAKAKEFYQQWNQHIRAITPKEKLLVWRFEDGWEPLCKHLRKPVPDCPLPRVNDMEHIQEKIRLLIELGQHRVSGGLGAGSEPWSCETCGMVTHESGE